MYKILCVCTGNICRSPTAEGALRHAIEDAGLGDKVFVDSAGMTAFHVGEAPDHRSTHAALKRGINIAEQRSRKVTKKDFYTFDLILALDEGHLKELAAIQPKDSTAELALFLSYCGNKDVRDVPDPYYGDHREFEYVLDLIAEAVKSLSYNLQQKLR